MDEDNHDFIRTIDNQPFARMLGIRLIDLKKGYARAEMSCPGDLENIFGTVHKGAIFSLIDEAFGAAANSHGTSSVALRINVSYLSPAVPGDTLRAEAREISRSERISSYRVEVRNQDEDLIATSEGMAYRKYKTLPFR